MIESHIQDQIEQADALLQADQVGDAYLAYRACLKEAGQEELIISVKQLSAIWMGIGSCYAARKQWAKALQWYQLSKTAVLSTAAFLSDTESAAGVARRATWEQYAPKGATTTLDHDVPEHALGNICEAIATAYENSDQPDRAALYHQHASTLFARAQQVASEPVVSADEETAVPETATTDSPLIADIDPFDLGPIPLGAIGNDNDALTILNHFGIRHFGAAQRKWEVIAEDLDVFKDDVETIRGITLHLYGQVERAVNVSFTMFQCRVVVAEKRPFADQEEPVFVVVSDDAINQQADTLIDMLDQMGLTL